MPQQPGPAARLAGMQHRRPRPGSLALLVAILIGTAAACSTAPTRAPATTVLGSIAPTPTEVGGPAADACRPTDIEIAHGLNEGAAGSRYTTMTLTVVGDAGCTIPRVPTVVLQDAGGVEVVRGVRAGEPGEIEVSAGASVSSDVQLSDWCEPPPAQPLTLLLALDEAEIVVDGGPFPGLNELPGCSGGAGVVFSASDWRTP